ncbi:hypothetical protein C8R43DRAFT_956299 [Mycena crocata]|nr:hypothetical protein C8R43DRAFT_956299 [Mycena crocata]
MLLRALLLLVIHGFVVVSGASCGCSSVTIPVHVDVLVPKNTSDIFGGLKSNLTDLRRVNDTYDIHGVFCRPNVPSRNADVLQLLVHGFSYTSQYWSPPVEEFQNYSYSAFSCDRGLSSLAIDLVGSGLSSRPKDPADVQFPTGAATLSQLARHLKEAAILPGVQRFRKIIGVGHSLGSGLFNFGAIVDGAQSPFDALVLTGELILDPNGPPLGSGTSAALIPARDSEPLRWAALDPGYFTVNDRTAFYPANTTAFSPRMLLFDELTKDVGTVSTFVQLPISSLPAEHYRGAVAKVVGSEDQGFCGNSRCVEAAALAEAERVVWPAARSFELVVSQGSGHDMNLDFAAEKAFSIIFSFVAKFSR